jgi:hypothetical protein
MAIPKNIEQIVLHMRKRLQKAVIAQIPPIPLYWNGVVGADLVVGRHWFACGGKITRIFVSIVGEVKKDSPAILRFEFSTSTAGRYTEQTIRVKEASIAVNIPVFEGEHLIVRANSEALVAVETAVLFIPDSNVLATAKAFYDEIERLDNEGNGDSFKGQPEGGITSGQPQPSELTGANSLLESPSVGGGSGADKSGDESGS